jgi:hypothetical protein
MGTYTTLYCETCRCDVEVIVANTQILDGVTPEDDVHVDEDHDLSGDLLEGLA